MTCTHGADGFVVITPEYYQLATTGAMRPARTLPTITAICSWLSAITTPVAILTSMSPTRRSGLAQCSSW
jgi:hypothetical protein